MSKQDKRLIWFFVGLFLLCAIAAGIGSRNKETTPSWSELQRQRSDLQYATAEELDEIERLNRSIGSGNIPEDVRRTVEQNQRAIDAERLFREHERLQQGR